MESKNGMPTVTVGILTYNHENFIAEAIDSVINQTGDFRLRIVILDDCSTDGTEQVIDNKIKGKKNIKYVRNRRNLGVQKNLRKMFELLEKEGSDFVTVLEGDDYYFSNNRLRRHIECHEKYQEILFSYNRILKFHQSTGSFDLPGSDFVKPTLTTADLAESNHIGTYGAAFYSRKIFKYLDNKFWKNEVYDWFMHIYLSQFSQGGVRQIPAPDTVYRLHEDSFWSSRTMTDRATNLLGLIDKYDKALGYKYSWNFSRMRNEALANLDHESLPVDDVAIFSSIFPSKTSGFSYYEFTEILKFFPRSVAYASGVWNSAIGGEISSDFSEYKISHKKLANRVRRLYDDMPIRAKLIYGVLLSDAYPSILTVANQHRIPFVFNLYPGGGMQFNNKEIDEKLRQIFSSPYFQKVICMQKPVVDYLLKRKLCRKEDIEFIFGVVTPKQMSASTKKYFDGKIKKTLDIAFVSHKYGDFYCKGYDVFIDIAKRLSVTHSDINFHIVGGYSQEDIDISGIKNIKFYGIRDTEWFHDFYKDIDIIISPTDRRTKETGLFDGFPTASTTDAGLNGVAMFTTDPLNMNGGIFNDGEEIVIIRRDADDIVNRVLNYYNNPNKLSALARAGQEAVRRIYSYDNQVKPRLKILSECLENPIIRTHKPSAKMRMYTKAVSYLRKIARKMIK